MDSTKYDRQDDIIMIGGMKPIRARDEGWDSCELSKTKPLHPVPFSLVPALSQITRQGEKSWICAYKKLGVSPANLFKSTKVLKCHISLINVYTFMREIWKSWICIPAADRVPCSRVPGIMRLTSPSCRSRPHHAAHVPIMMELLLKCADTSNVHRLALS